MGDWSPRCLERGRNHENSLLHRPGGCFRSREFSPSVQPWHRRCARQIGVEGFFPVDAGPVRNAGRTGNNRVWNPPPKPPAWDYRDKTRKFIEQNKDRIGIIALGNSICFADIESGYYDVDEYVTWYHDFHEFVHRLNPRIKIAPGDLQSAWGGLQGTEQLASYLLAYEKRYGEKMPIDAIGLHCYITGNKPPEWAKPEVISVDTFKQKIRAMRAFMKRANLQDTAFVITEMGVFNHHCEPRLTEPRLIEIMEGAIRFIESPEGIDKELGMPSDGYRLVQKWSYSAFPHLVREGKLTPMGKAYRMLVDAYGNDRKQE
jgi:hypothetical protein